MSTNAGESFTSATSSASSSTSTPLKKCDFCYMPPFITTYDDYKTEYFCSLGCFERELEHHKNEYRMYDEIIIVKKF